jgi:hypothetical protein
VPALLLFLQVKASRRSLADPKYAQIHARYRKQLIEVSRVPGSYHMQQCSDSN